MCECVRACVSVCVLACVRAYVTMFPIYAIVVCFWFSNPHHDATFFHGKETLQIY